MSDDYRKGAAAADADFPHNRLAARAFEQLAKNAFGLLPGAQAREDEFRAGYEATYRAKSTDPHRVHKVQPAPHNSAPLSLSLPLSIQPSIEQDDTMGSYRDIAHTTTGRVNSSLSRQSGGGGLTSYQEQIKLLQELRASLMKFETSLSLAAADYQAKVAELEGFLLSEDYAGFVAHHLEPACERIHRLRELIMEHSVTAVERVTQQHIDRHRI